MPKFIDDQILREKPETRKQKCVDFEMPRLQIKLTCRYDQLADI